MLDLVERPLQKEAIRYCRRVTYLRSLLALAFTKRMPLRRLDGSMSQEKRSRTLDAFSSDPSVRVLLLSLRAGGVGLNLVSAQTIYLLDPWWNPAVEEQAVHRIHRIGQVFPVRVKHYVVQNTVEDRILELQKRKSALIKGALGAADDVSKEMRIEDLRLLFS